MKIKYFAWIKTITNIDEENINDSSIKDLKTLKKYLILKYPKLEKYFHTEKIIQIAVNFEYVYKNKKLKIGDEIALLPPVSGG